MVQPLLMARELGFETEASARAHAMNYDSLRMSAVSYIKSLNNIFVVFVNSAR
jgi:hypothetical protein